MSADVLTRRAINRATLERQLLLRPSQLSPLEAVEHLVGMQAQIPLNPCLGLWSRLDGFEPNRLGELLLDRRVVRIVAMRATLHLLTADDCLMLRPMMQPVLDGELARHRDYGPALVEVDIAAVLAFARSLMAEKPRSGPELRAALHERFPERNAAALAYACRNLLALVQVPPRGVWGRTAQVSNTTAEVWLGRPLVRDPSIDDVVLRYLRAYGPATVADVASWSRLTRLRAVVERLRPRLRVFRDENGRELFDLPEAPRPDPDTPAPPRFLPEYDNALLSHADRSRFVSEENRGPGYTDAMQVLGTVLYDGSLCGTWRTVRDAGTGDTTLVVDHSNTLTRRAATGLTKEGGRVLRFLHPGADPGDVRFVAAE